MPQQSEREDTTTWTAPVMEEGTKQKNSFEVLNLQRTLLEMQSRQRASPTRVEELLHYFAISCRQTLVQVAHAVSKGLL